LEKAFLCYLQGSSNGIGGIHCSTGPDTTPFPDIHRNVAAEIFLTVTSVQIYHPYDRQRNTWCSLSGVRDSERGIQRCASSVVLQPRVWGIEFELVASFASFDESIEL
jgi:hypothetical protein